MRITSASAAIIAVCAALSACQDQQLISPTMESSAAKTGGGTTCPGIPGKSTNLLVTPSTVSLTVGQTVDLNATNQNGTAIADCNVKWSSGATSIATVSNTGLVTAVASGTVNIQASMVIANRTLTGTAQVTAVPSVASVEMSPAAASLSIGESKQLDVLVKDVNENVLIGRTITWSASNANATVSPAGLVTGIALGQTTITASSEGKSATATITVTPPFPASGLLAYLPMSGSTNDSSGLGNHFTNNGGTFVADRFNVPNTAVKFDGNAASASRDWPTFPKSSGTVAFWFRNADTGYTYSTYSYFLWGTLPRAGGGTTSQWRMVIDQNSGYCTSLGGTGDGYTLYWNYGTSSVFGTLVESTPKLASCLNLAVVATWRHVAMVVANNEISIYENGQFRQKMAVTAWTAASTTAYLGVLDNTTAGNGAARYIDSFGVWNRPLTASEIDALYRFK